MTRAKSDRTAVASFAACKYLKQVTIGSRVQITKSYLKIILSLARWLLCLHAADECLKWMHCCSYRPDRHRRCFALCTVDHFYLSLRLRSSHHSVNYFPNCEKRPRKCGDLCYLHQHKQLIPLKWSHGKSRHRRRQNVKKVKAKSLTSSSKLIL